MRWLPAAALAAAATALRAPSTRRQMSALRLSPAEVMYEAQRAAMCASAEQEGILFEGHTKPLATKKLSYAKKKRRGKKASCLLYTSPSPRDQRGSRMPSSA